VVDEGEIGFQEYFVGRRHGVPVRAVRYAGADDARPAPGVLDAIARARAVIVGPSNPILSIAPMLAIPGLRDALLGTPAPVVAVSPLVHGEVRKGPTAECMRWAGHALGSDGIAAVYSGLLDGLVADQRASAVPTLETDVALDTPEQRRDVAQRTVAFAEALRD
jgi:LPPG:FO 2-phospho-L-lactate transferase